MQPSPRLPLPSGRRADIAAVGASGEIWIVEVKSCLNDFRTDQKWEEYRTHCDRLFFAVDCDFPLDVLPEDAGLMVVDGYGGSIIREASPHPLAAATRKAVTIRIARIGASRLKRDPRPEDSSRTSLSYRGARFARMRCKVRRCMLRRRAVSETLRSQSSYTRWICSQRTRSADIGFSGGGAFSPATARQRRVDVIGVDGLWRDNRPRPA